MAEQENVRIVQEAYESFKRGDIQALLGTLADDIEWTTPGPTNTLPLAGQRRGREQVAEFFSLLDETQESQHFEPKEFIAQGDTVVVLGNYRWRVKSTGRTIESDWVHVFTVRDGKTMNFREYFDTAAAVEAQRTTTAQTAQAT